MQPKQHNYDGYIGGSEPVVSNVKAQFAILDPFSRIGQVLDNEDELSSFCLTVKKYSNFSVVRLIGQRYVYTVWNKKTHKPTLHVNVTAVPSFDLVQDAISMFCLYLSYPQTSVIENTIRVDSSTFTGRLATNDVNLVALLRKINGSKQSGVVGIINPQARRTLLVKFHDDNGGVLRKQGTLTVYKSGKVNILGAKSEEQALGLWQWAKENLEEESAMAAAFLANYLETWTVNGDP